MPSNPALKHGGRQRNMDVRAQQIAAVGFVDWQTVAVGPWVHDVNYFLVSALDVPDRRVHDRDLLGHYLKALATFGVSSRTGRGVERLPPGDGLRVPGLAVQPGPLAAGRREHRDVRTLRHGDDRSRYLRRPGGVMPPGSSAPRLRGARRHRPRFVKRCSRSA
jgi:hypothetical protein